MSGMRITWAGAGLTAGLLAAATAGAGPSLPRARAGNLAIKGFSVRTTPMGSLARYRILNRGSGVVRAHLLITRLDGGLSWAAWRRRHGRRWSPTLAGHLGRRPVWERQATLRPGLNVRVVPLPARVRPSWRLVLWVDPPTASRPTSGKRSRGAEAGAAACARVGPIARRPRHGKRGAPPPP